MQAFFVLAGYSFLPMLADSRAPVVACRQLVAQDFKQVVACRQLVAQEFKQVVAWQATTNYCSCTGCENFTHIVYCKYQQAACKDEF